MEWWNSCNNVAANRGQAQIGKAAPTVFSLNNFSDNLV